MFKRIVCMVLLFTLLGSVTNASAAVKRPPDASIQSTRKPSEIWDWADGKYDFSGAADYQTLYTNVLFTSATEVSITVENTSKKSECNVEVYSIEAWYKADVCVSHQIISVGNTRTWTVSGLDSSKKYYISFGAPCKFKGNISKNK